jgi:very-short-patch-repair endonuclease
MKRLIHNVKPLSNRRRELRQTLTAAEATLWRHLKKSQLGCKFRRQHSVGPYVLDFYCPERRLAIELDGDVHQWDGRSALDLIRTRYLEEFNIYVMRIENRWVFENTDVVLAAIKHQLEQQLKKIKTNKQE